MVRWLLLSILAVGCEGPAGPPGPTGDPGSDGSPGTNGDAGANGSNGQSPWLTAPGVAIDVTALAVDASGATVSFTLTDGKGTALDRSGLLTDGAVNVS